MERDVPYIAFESEMARHERKEVRMLKVIVALIIVIFLNNVGWLLFFNQFDFESDLITLNSQEEGNANYMGGNGVIDNGRSNSTED